MGPAHKGATKFCSLLGLKEHPAQDHDLISMLSGIGPRSQSQNCLVPSFLLKEFGNTQIWHNLEVRTDRRASLNRDLVSGGKSEHAYCQAGK
jgi:hypothetical protein